MKNKEQNKNNHKLSVMDSAIPNERELLVTIYIYDQQAGEVDFGDVMNVLDCSYYSACGLLKKHYIIGTDAYSPDEACVAHFIAALKSDGMQISHHEFTLSHKNEH